ncbi:hypothetical protein [Kitasatospora sp. MBT63]|uniref:hypothetical protein n=1 Tax=Kitasatospora sp. MBT63 TaxID=1444768 RepID=UPI00068AF493|nr:hypothetical protein [Kitasatospora sp. MBT63]
MTTETPEPAPAPEAPAAPPGPPAPADAQPAPAGATITVTDVVEAGTEPGTQAGTEAEAEADADAGTGAETGSAAPARRISTARLMVAALLIGPLLGAVGGYAIQAGRAPTPLPPLQVGAPHYPATTLDEQAAAAARPKPLVVDGDLRKLLISKPDGAEQWDDFGYGDDSGWMSIGEKALSYGGADRRFRSMLQAGFRRDAFLAWRKGETKYLVELIQYDDDSSQSAVADINEAADGQPLDGGTINGYYSASDKQLTYAESTEKYYYGEAVARRGTVAMVITVYSPTQVNGDELKALAKLQWERLV